MLKEAEKSRRSFEPFFISPSSEKGKENALWREFAREVAAPTSKSLEEYAQNPATFPKERYALRGLISADKQSHDPNGTYSSRGSYSLEPDSDNRLFIDAPFAYSLQYLRDDGAWETITVASFVPDLEKKVILIDQLQGGDTQRGRVTNEARRARMKFKEQPEQILFDAVEDLGQRTSMRGIGLRKSETIKWMTVQNARKEGKVTVYDKVSDANDMRGFASKEYDLIPISPKQEAK